MGLKCLDCMGEQPNQVKVCPCTDCTLWLYRFGKNPQTIKNKLLTDKTFFNKNVNLESNEMMRLVGYIHQ